MCVVGVDDGDAVFIQAGKNLPLGARNCGDRAEAFQMGALGVVDERDRGLCNLRQEKNYL